VGGQVPAAKAETGVRRGNSINSLQTAIQCLVGSLLLANASPKLDALQEIVE
jgi:hypothetical protein